MKKMTKRYVVAATVAAICASVVSGCGAASNDSMSVTSDGKTAVSGADNKTHVEFFNQKTEIVDILHSLIAKYEEQNPDVVIDLVTPSDAATVLSTRMASGDTPDIFTQWPIKSFFEQVDSGYVMDLSETGIMDNIQETARVQWKYNEGEYTAPMSYNCSGIWVNDDLLSKAGISEKPSTWDELIKDCKTLSNAGITPFITSAKTVDITDRQLQVFLASSMGDQYQSFEEDAGNASVDESAEYAATLNKMAEKIVEIAGYSQSDMLGTDQDSATADFANGDGAFMIGGSWLLASITAANPEIKVSMMPIPGNTEADTNTCAFPGDMSLCISSSTKVKEAAVAFVKWMTSTDIAAEYAKAEGNPSCIKGVDYVAPQFKDLYDNYVSTGKYILNPDHSWSSAQQNAAGSAVQQLYYDKDTKTFAANLASAFNE